MAFETIVCSEKNGVGTITINRPQFANAFATETYQEIADAVEAYDSDPAVNAIVITGAGKHFSAGGDIKRFKQLIDSGEYLSAEGIIKAGRMPKTIRMSGTPTIAVVNGVATGAGLSCALACDFRVVEPKSKLIMAFSNLGLCGDTAATYTLPALIGPARAAKMMMLGAPVAGEEAVQIGLADVLAEQGSLLETGLGFAEKIAGRSHAAISAQKKLLNKYQFGDFDQALKDEAELMQEASRKPDFAEAVNAFLEKRPAVFNK